MRFIKRLIFVFLLLVIAFFIYRLISPKAAQSLLFDLKTFSNDKIGTHFSLDTKTVDTTWSTDTTWSALIITGTLPETVSVIIPSSTVLEQTWSLQEVTGDEDLFFNDSVSPQENTATEIVTSSTSSVLVPTTTSVVTLTTTPAVHPKPTASYRGLSTQDKRDMQNILNSFSN